MLLDTEMASLEIAQVDLRAPFTSDTILEVRRGKMKNMANIQVLSGIEKSLCDGSVWIGKGGIEEDEHDYTFHGGPDKAVHGCKSR
jgi:MOSC domain-containing protein YiiM